MNPRRTSRQPKAEPVHDKAYLGIEAGGTRTSVLLVDEKDHELAAFQAGPAVLPLMSDRELQWHFRDVAGRLPCLPSAISIGMAGARSESDRDRLHRVASRVWPAVPCLATNDLETALAAAPWRQPAIPRVLVLSGTGSCCFGRDPDGRTAKVGGRGHVIGDRASACDIGLRALRAVMADLDHHGRMGALGAAILGALLFNEPEQLIPWSVHAGKSEIAGLAVTVFAVARRGDRLAKGILAEAAAMLAEDAVVCARQLVSDGGKVEFVLNGGVLLKNPSFMRDVSRRIRHAWPDAQVTPLKKASVWGAVELARSLQGTLLVKEKRAAPDHLLPRELADLSVLAQSPTERRNPRSLTLDKMPVGQGIRLMLAEEELLPQALRAEATRLEKVIQAVVRAFKSGGRLFYVGAGTSGRLGVLDASEIPPTFRAPREQVQGIIAGGRQALWSAVEGAEDDLLAGALAIRNRAVGARDVVVGIAASGRTPFVWGALKEARERGAFTALVCFNPAMRRAVNRVRDKAWHPDVVIAPDVGPEILTGSTRLKSGTATKLVLNMITTLAMTKVDKVISNLMVDLNPSNVKLRDRAVRILGELTGAAAAEVRDALVRNGWVLKDAHDDLRRVRPRRASRPAHA